MLLRPPGAPRNDTVFPNTTLFSSVPGRAPTLTPLVNTVWPSFTRVGELGWMFGASPAANEAAAGVPSSFIAAPAGAISHSVVGVGPGCDVAPLSHSGRSATGIVVGST